MIRARMIRALSLLGFGGGFLMISPNLRNMVTDGLATAVGDLDKYSPWSYLGCAVLGLFLATMSLNKGSRPR
jgi:hypothetical protein